MKKEKLFFIVFFLWILSGCSPTPSVEKAPALGRVVARVEVSCCQSGEVQQFTYRMPQKMEAVLSYLRLLEYRGKATIDPERIRGDSYQIAVITADGTTHNYYQRADRYLSRDNHPWEMIDPKQAQNLRLLLQEMPSDTR